MPYMVTFTINIPQMLAYIPYMDPMGYNNYRYQVVHPKLGQFVSSSPSLRHHFGGPEVLCHLDRIGSWIDPGVPHGFNAFKNTPRKIRVNPTQL